MAEKEADVTKDPLWKIKKKKNTWGTWEYFWASNLAVPWARPSPVFQLTQIKNFSLSLSQLKLSSPSLEDKGILTNTAALAKAIFMP